MITMTSMITSGHWEPPDPGPPQVCGGEGEEKMRAGCGLGATNFQPVPVVLDALRGGRGAPFRGLLLPVCF